MLRLVLLRHGESQWNLENKFTGWTDIGLTDKGVLEAINSGKILSKNNFFFDIVYTSFLKRAKNTTHLCLNQMSNKPTIFNEWRLNERHYGSLQGLNKAKTAHEFGENQVHIWRRSYDVAPPPLKTNDKRHPSFDILYNKINKKELPNSESLKDTVIRIKPLWENDILPKIKAKEKIMLVAHGNSLRAIIQILENHSNEEIMKVNIPTGSPLVYQLDSKFKTINSFYLK